MADTIRFDADASPAIRELDRLASKLNDVQNKFKDSFGKMTDHAKTLAAALVAAGTAVAAYADDITDIADANQVAINQVLGLSKALEGSGGKAENVGKMFQTMSNNIEEANAGNLKTLATFNRLGVSLEDLGKKSNTALKDQLLDGLVKIKDPIERNALAMQIFGKSLVGVNIEKFAADQKRLAAEMAPYAASIETAGAAWDNMVSILGSLKLAFAEAFQPVFWLLSKLSVNVEAAAIAFRLLAIGIAAAVAPAILGGMAKLVDLVKTLTIAAAKNPFIAIATALLAIGPSVANYLGLMKETTDEQGKSNDASLEGQRNQEGINEAIKKQKESLTQVGEQLQRNWKKAGEKYDLDLRTLDLSEQQKKAIEDQAKIEQEAQDALFQLKQKYDALDAAGRARNKKAYEEEVQAIKAGAEEQKKSSEQSLAAIAARAAQINDIIKSYNIWTSKTGEILQNEAKLATSVEANAGNRIQLEAQVNEVMMRRQAIAEQLSKLSVGDQIKINTALNNATLTTSDLIGKTNDLGNAFDDAFRQQIRGAGLSREAFNRVTEGVALQNNAIRESTGISVDSQRTIYQQSRLFETGWKQAFNSYVDNATNAAAEAKRIFELFTQGMEDLLVNLFKTGKFEWKNFLNAMVEELLRSQIRQTMANIFNFGGSNQGGGNIFGSLGKMLGFANGGIIPTNGPVIVGERGPEILTGAAGRQVIPNNQLGGSTIVNYNINAVDAASFKQLVARDPSFIHAVAMQGAMAIPRR